jgi:ubiquinone/menaquinone biosynthesis C-methylase UbiE
MRKRGERMPFFNWAAPAFGHFGDRWSTGDVNRWAALLRPSLGTGGGRVLDLGGGTGALAVRLAEATGAAFTVLDPTPEMLRYLKTHEQVTGMVGAAEAMPFGEGEFDACLVSDAFHHFRDQDLAVREIVRVVRPGGALLMLEFEPRGLAHLIAWGERLTGEPAAFFSPPELCDFMAARGVHGTCERTSGTNYFFIGTARAPAPSA